MSDKFKVAGLSGIAIVWTVGFIGAFLYFVLGIVLSIYTGTTITLFDIVGSALLLSLIVYSWLSTVGGYIVDGENITIVRHGPGRIVIPLEKITSAAHKPAIGNFFNTGFFGLGGLFGWAGRTRVRNPTDIDALEAEVYGTNPKHSVVLEMENGNTIVLTPTDPQAFLASLQKVGVQPPAPAAISRARKVRKR